MDNRNKTNEQNKKNNPFDKENQKQIFSFTPVMKQVSIIMIALLVFLQPLSKTWIFVSFKINEESIAKTLCVKKEIRNNTCKGKCHLKKQLEKANEEEQKQSPTNTKDKVEVLYFYSQFSFDLFKPTVFYESRSLVEYKSDFYDFSFITDFFRPPQKNNLI